MVDDIDRAHYQPIATPDGRQDRIFDKMMWNFWVDITRRIEVPDVEYRAAPQTATVGQLPPDPGTEVARLTVPVRGPQWGAANYWGQPLGDAGTNCLLFYKTWYTVYHKKIPDDRLAVLRKVSYEIENLNDNEVFEIQVLRNGEELARWEDMRIDSAQANPARQYVFAGHFLPIDSFFRYDQDDDIVIRMRVLGPEAPIGTFPATTTDQCNVNAKVVVQGWLSTMLDRRSGVPRPVDPAYPLDIFGNPIPDPILMEKARQIAQHLFKRRR